MKRILPILCLLLSLIPLTLASGSAPPPPSVDVEALDSVRKAIEQAVAIERESVLAFIVSKIRVQNVTLSADGNWGVAWLIPTDPETGQPAPIEPGLAIAIRTRDGWRVILPTSREWIDYLQAAPEDVLPAGQRDAWLKKNETQAVAAPSAALSGYLLPWEAGVTRNLTQSTCHDEYTPSGNAHYAFDFSTYGVLWNIYAAKNSVVWLWKDDVPTCYEPTCSDTQDIGNYIVLKDESTNPVTYQLYLHLAQDSIPDEIKVQGTPIAQGQFIGIVDNTGQSWGHHLHFQVQIPLYGEDYYWGQSVDITFDDVDINGGRPRVINSWCDDSLYCTREDDVCNDFRAEYTSQNVITTDGKPPEGDILEPLANQTFLTGTLRLEGWASDEDSGLQSAQFLAYYNGAWQDIGPAFSSSLFSYDWDWCADQVPDGPLSLALRLTDNAGNQNLALPGLRHAVKQYACPATPACQPGSNQVAIFADTVYGGDCQILDIGEYPSSASFGAVGDDNTASIQVGSAVMAALFSEPNFGGRAETLASDDPNLAENRLGADSLSSLKVITRTVSPAIPTLTWPEEGAVFSDTVSLSLMWNDPGGATAFRGRLAGPSGVVTAPWQSAAYWPLGSLPTGSYTWTVQARNENGESAWAAARGFSIINDASSLPPAFTAPFSDTLEGDVSAWQTTGLWHLTSNVSHSSTRSWWYSQPVTGTYGTGSATAGSLTTPPIILPVDSDPYRLEFWSRYATEGPYPHWDQRWVQISVDGGPFTNTIQLVNDPANTWVKATVDLSPYYDPATEHTVQLRFHFNSLDEVNNGFAGWYVDDVQVSAAPPEACSDVHEPNDDPSQAVAMAYNDQVTAAICPPGEYDYYQFTGSAGDQVVVDIDARSQGSPLDSIVYLLAADGSSELAVHDDEILGVRQDPHLGYTLPADGTYYLRLQAWNHPMGTGPYTLTLTTDGTRPVVSNLYPPDGIYLPAMNLNLTVDATDAQSGVSHVRFWKFVDGWAEISRDWEGTDGWQATFDTSTLTEGDEIDFYIQAYDWAGNWEGEGSWSHIIDFSPPDTTANALPNPSDSTAVHLQWTATDNLAGIRKFDIRVKVNSESWQLLAGDLPPNTSEWWFVGEAGNDYTFRIRGIDDAGNIEAYVDGAEVSTTIPDMATLCSTPDAWDVDALTNDNAFTSATAIGLDPQTHNFCNPASGDYLNDEDWYRFTAEAGAKYKIWFTPLHESAGAVISLFDADGSTLLAEVETEAFGRATALDWTAPADSEYYFRIRHLNGLVAGDDVSYRVQVGEYLVFLPLILR